MDSCTSGDILLVRIRSKFKIPDNHAREADDRPSWGVLILLLSLLPKCHDMFCSLPLPDPGLDWPEVMLLLPSLLPNHSPCLNGRVLNQYYMCKLVNCESLVPIVALLD